LRIFGTETKNKRRSRKTSRKKRFTKENIGEKSNKFMRTRKHENILYLG
jgi:hypothetical protein